MVEFELVERFAGLLWRLRRVPRFEAAIIQQKIDDPLIREDAKTAVVASELVHSDTLSKLSRYETTLMNAVSRTLNLLQLLRKSRAAAEDAPRVIESAVAQPVVVATKDAG
jgi:hypothetical protein